MKNAFKLITILACASVAWALQGGPKDVSVESQEAIEKAVLAAHAQMGEAEKSLDAERFFAFIPDFDKGLIIQDGVLFQTRQEALDAVRTGFRGVSKVERTYDRTYVTAISPEVALLTASGAFSVTLSDGRVLSGPFAASMVFVQRDGQWRLLQGHYSAPNPR